MTERKPNRPVKPLLRFWTDRPLAYKGLVVIALPLAILLGSLVSSILPALLNPAPKTMSAAPSRSSAIPIRSTPCWQKLPPGCVAMP